MNTFIPKLIGTFLNLLAYLNQSIASNLALDLFSKPLKGRLKEPHPLLESSEKKLLYYKNLDIATYQWKGSKQTVLLAHGWQSNSVRWKNIIIRLRKLDYNIVALDAPAHGTSGSKIFNAVLYSKFIEVVCKEFKPSILMGHSVGGMAISYFLKNNSNYKADTLVFLGTPAGFPAIFENYSDLMGYNKIVRAGMEVIIQKRFGQPSSYFNTAQFAKEIDCHCLLVHDELDPVIPYSDALEIQLAFKNSHLFTTQGLGHGLKSKKVIDKIIDFIPA